MKRITYIAAAVALVTVIAAALLLDRIWGALVDAADDGPAGHYPACRP